MATRVSEAGRVAGEMLAGLEAQHEAWHRALRVRVRGAWGWL